MRRLLLVLGLALLAACGKDATPPTPVGSVTLPHDTATLVPTATLQLTPTVKDIQGNVVTRALTYTSSNISLSTVSADGHVTAFSTGVVTITATSESKSASLQVTIKDGAIVGATGGTVTVLSGTAILTIPAGALSSNTMITMEPALDAPLSPRLVTGTAVNIGPPNLQFATSAQLQLKYGVAQVPTGASEQLLRIQRVLSGAWQPVDGSTVDPVGKIVTASLTRLSTFGVLSSAIASVTLSVDHATLDIGATVQLTATALDAANAPVADAPIAWSSSDPSVAKVDQNGLVTAVFPGGPITITATSNGKNATAAITVTAKQSVVASTTNVSFTASVGSSDPAPQSISITAAGIASFSDLTATVTYPAGAPTGWLNATLAGTTTPTQLNLATTIGPLTAGTYTAKVTVTSSLAGTGPAIINVSLILTAPTIVANAGAFQAAMAGTQVPVPPSVLVKDGQGNPIANATVSFSVIEGGGSLTNSVATTDASGVATVGSWTLGGVANPNTVQATVTGFGFTAANNSVLFKAPGCQGGGGTGYAITLCFVTTMTTNQRSAFVNAAARWSTIITGDVSDIPIAIAAGVCGPLAPAVNMTIDDLLIFARIEPIDGVNGVLGSAAPCIIRSSNKLPIIGQMRFDEADMANLEANGSLGNVILHEMGHVLGIGTIWNLLGLLAQPSIAGGSPLDTHFTGVNAIAGFDLIGGTTYTGGAKVPVENRFGAGTINAHWRENVLLNELMTGFLNAGANPLSLVTVRSLEDLGYTVNESAADAFQLTLSLRAGTDAAAQAIPYGNDIIPGPYHTVDDRGRLTRRK